MAVMFRSQLRAWARDVWGHCLRIGQLANELDAPTVAYRRALVMLAIETLEEMGQ